MFLTFQALLELLDKNLPCYSSIEVQFLNMPNRQQYSPGPSRGFPKLGQLEYFPHCCPVQQSSLLSVPSPPQLPPPASNPGFTQSLLVASKRYYHNLHACSGLKCLLPGQWLKQSSEGQGGRAVVSNLWPPFPPFTPFSYLHRPFSFGTFIILFITCSTPALFAELQTPQLFHPVAPWH